MQQSLIAQAGSTDAFRQEVNKLSGTAQSKSILQALLLLNC